MTSHSSQDKRISDFLEELSHAVSRVRLEAYRPNAGSDLDTIVTYFWNITLCEALYPSLDAVEVVLRNSMHRVLSGHFQSEYWFDDKRLVRPVQQRQVAIARQKLIDRRQLQTAGKIVAELNFGFWVGMLNKPYEDSIWRINRAAMLRSTVPYAVRRIQGRPFLHSRFHAISQLRNRVMHYEPIWQRPDLLGDHAEILQAIGWISPSKGAAIELIDRFGDVHASGRAEIEAKLKVHILKLP